MLSTHIDTYIICEGKRLEEYAVVKEDNGTATCYIPSEAGKNFEVHWRVSSSIAHKFSVRCYVDGRSAGHTSCSSGESGIRKGVRTAVNMRRLFQFAKLQTTDDDEYINVHQQEDSLGSITVSFLRVKERKNVGFSAKRFTDIGPVHETTKKIATHCVSLGDVQPCHAGGSYKSITLDSNTRPFAKFIFRYKSRDLLQADGLLSPAKGSSSTSSKKESASDQLLSTGRDSRKRKINKPSDAGGRETKRRRATTDAPVEDVELWESQLNDVQRKVHIIKSKIKKVKAYKLGSPRVKKETMPIRPKQERLSMRLSSAAGEVIDLTLDD